MWALTWYNKISSYLQGTKESMLVSKHKLHTQVHEETEIAQNKGKTITVFLQCRRFRERTVITYKHNNIIMSILLLTFLGQVCYKAIVHDYVVLLDSCMNTSLIHGV